MRVSAPPHLTFIPGYGLLWFCCLAFSATCLACGQGVSVDDFCQLLPTTFGGVALPVGLYRCAGHAGAPLPFVSTNPRGDARVNANDRVLVLAPQDWIGFEEEEEN